MTNFPLVRLLISCLLVLLLLAGCQTMPSATDEDPLILGRAEVERLFVGNTVESYNLNTKLTSFTYYHPNGQALQERLWARRTGTWSIRDDGQICLAMGKGRTKCRHIIYTGRKYYKIRPDKKGNPERIVRYRYFAEGNALSN